MKGDVRFRLLFLLLLGALPAFFVSLGANSIWDANEAFYVETPRQMVLSGDYVNPSFNGQPRFNKPVLSYWIVAGLYQAFGISVTAERIGIALGAVGIVLATFLIGRAMGSARIGLVAALIVATSPRVVMHGRRIFIDVFITLFMALALAAFVWAERQPEHRRRYLFLMYVALGLAVLTKGPAFLALAGLVAFVWLATERRLRDIRHLWLPAGLLVVIAIVTPWYALVFSQHGWTHITSFLVGENLSRFASAMTPAGRDAAFFLPVLLSDLLPWAPIVIAPLAIGWRGQMPGEPVTHASLRRLLWCWVVVVVGVFSFSETKEDLYIFPAAPAAAALIADALVQSEFGRVNRVVRVLLGFVACAMVGLAGAALWVLRDSAFASAHVLPAALAIGLGGLIASVCVLRGRGLAAVAALAAGMVVFNYVFVARLLPDVERLKPAPAIASVFHERYAPDARFGQFNMSFPSLVFYLDRVVDEIGSPEQAEAYFRDAPEQRWLLLSVRSWEALQPRLVAAEARMGPVCEKKRLPLMPATFLEIVRGTRPTEIVLVTNRCR